MPSPKESTEYCRLAAALVLLIGLAGKAKVSIQLSLLASPRIHFRAVFTVFLGLYKTCTLLSSSSVHLSSPPAYIYFVGILEEWCTNHDNSKIDLKVAFATIAL